MELNLIINISLGLAAIGFMFLALKKNQTETNLKKDISHLNKTIDELDHQAKLIIKSDMELKLYQEEVEDKLNKLNLLKNMIISSIHILDKEELFSQINEKTINDLGFKKGLILEFNSLEPKLNIGFLKQELETISNFLAARKNTLISQPLISIESEDYQKIAQNIETKDILIAAVKTKDEVSHIFILSQLVVPTDIQRAEKEIFSIICMYLGQCLDNIALFEDLYHNKDILEKKIKERTNELVKSLREIEIVSKMKSDFISSVSHELRTPLTSVKGFSALLVEEKFGKLPDAAKKRLEKIDDNVNKLVNMVNTLLDISRIESGKMEIKIAPADIAKLIKDTADFLTPQIQTKQIRLSIVAPQTLRVYMDKNLIERVLINLFNNAIKFTPGGGRITIEARAEKDSAIISVADNGCGIKETDLEKVFQEFYRIDNTINREVKGTGLGLSLVKRIINTHKEKVWVESQVDKGTTFYFTLKKAIGQETAAKEKKDSSSLPIDD